METRTNWGIIAVACAFAVLAIGVAVSTAFFDTTEPTVAAVTEGNSNNYTGSDWQKALSSIASTTVGINGDYRAPAELSTTEALSRELIVKYLELKGTDSYTSAEAERSVAELVERNIQEIKPPTTYTAASVKTSNVALDTYTGNLGTTLRPSTEIREYELVVFGRAVGSSNFNGSPELAASAAVYSKVEKDLAAMAVPQSVAAEHLALLQSTAGLAHATHLLAVWSGDPINALAYVDAFVKTERSLQGALSALFAKITVVAQKS